MWTLLGASISVLAALASCAAALWLYTSAYKVWSEHEEVKQQVGTLRGRLNNAKGVDRKTVREEVESALSEREVQSGGGMFEGELGEMMLPMLLGGMGGGGGGNPLQEMMGGNAQQDSPVEGEQETDRSFTYGSGGKLNDAKTRTE